MLASSSTSVALCDGCKTAVPTTPAAVPIPAAAAIIAAVENALKPYGVVLTDVPATPMSLIAKIAAGSPSQAAE